jgi:uncharacterized protein
VVGPTGHRHRLSTEDGAELVRFAATVIRARLLGLAIDGRPPRSAALRAVGASFVTLYREGALRGCIGSLEPARPLYRDASANAVRAMTDPRLEPVRVVEWGKLELTVSVLSRPAPLMVRTFDELYAEVRPFIDGLTLTDGRRRATFLPAVWEKLPEPADFVAGLLHKGGWLDPGSALDPGGASGTGRAYGQVVGPLPPGLAVSRYQAAEFHDPGPRPPL